VSGIVLYFTPQGKIANWTNWTLWGLDKHTWGAMHINSSLIFFVIIIFHIYYNWKLLWAYIKKRTQAAINLKLELAIVLLFSIFIVMASIKDIQPFKQIIDWNQGMKDYWALKAEAQPPIPHAEEMTVEEFCENLKVPLEDFQSRMKAKGWTFAPNQTIQNIAENNHISPADIYKQVQTTGSPAKGNGAGSGGGWGRMTVEHVCTQQGVSLDVALAKLAEQNIDAKATDNVRTLANQLGQRPSAIISIITGEPVVH
jgi:hypothetical protein